MKRRTTTNSSALPDALDGRTAAALAVADVLTGKEFVGATLRAFRATHRLDGRESGLAMEIGLGTIRHLLTIEHVLGSLARFTPEQTKPRLRAILYTAVYQIVWMDRVPPFAAVDEAVELARRLVRGRTPGMVNAVLRRVAGAVADRRGPWRRLDPDRIRVSWEQACIFSRPVLPPPETSLSANLTPALSARFETQPGMRADVALVAHRAAATGERPERFAELVERFGPAVAENIAWASQAIPVTVLQRNSLRIGADEFVDVLSAALGEGVEFAGDSAFVPAGVSLFELPAWTGGLVYVQDTSAHAAALAVGVRPGERILDLCAAPGGKSLALALEMGNRGAVVACDTDATRLARVTENAARLGLDCIRTQALTGTDADFAGSAPFDAALVDVPCSNSGVIARRPEARLGLTPQKLRSLVGLQGELLRRAAALVRAGGRLVYSTCSIEPQENRQVVTDFLDEHPGWRLEEQAELLPAWGPRPAAWRDGGYWARLSRTG